MENKLIVSLSPHVHGGDSVQKNMYGVLIALSKMWKIWVRITGQVILMRGWRI